jgi:hypothetical protein
LVGKVTAMRGLTVLRVSAAARIGIGTALALGTRPALKAMLGREDPSPPFVLFARTVGVRDALFGLGCLLGSLAGRDPDETRRWVRLWLANEVVDVAVAVAAYGQLGPAGAAAAAAPPLPLIAADVWVLRQLRRETRSGS